MSRKKRSQRGFSMLEVLTAGAILMVGLTGITVMLTNISSHTRDGTTSINGSVMASQVIQEYSALGYDGLSALAVSDAGQALDYSGRKFNRQVEVLATVSDAGVPSYQINVEVSWKDLQGNTRRNVATTVVSQVPDAG